MIDETTADLYRTARQALQHATEADHRMEAQSVGVYIDDVLKTLAAGSVPDVGGELGAAAVPAAMTRETDDMFARFQKITRVILAEFHNRDRGKRVKELLLALKAARDVDAREVEVWVRHALRDEIDERTPLLKRLDAMVDTNGGRIIVEPKDAGEQDEFDQLVADGRMAKFPMESDPTPADARRYIYPTGKLD